MSGHEDSRGSGSVRAWLRSITHRGSGPNSCLDPDHHVVPSFASSSNSNLPSSASSSDMLSFHHTMDSDKPPTFSPPVRSFSGGSGPFSFESAAGRTIARPLAATSTRSKGDNGNTSQSTLQPPDSGTSPPLGPGLSRTLSGVSSLTNLIQHQRRASEAYRRMRAGSNSGSDTKSPKAVEGEPSLDSAVLSRSPECATDDFAGMMLQDNPQLPPAPAASSSSAEKLQRDYDAADLRRPSLGESPLLHRRASSNSSTADSPELLLPEGEPMLKVTHKKVKSRTFKLDPDRGQILWESKKNNRVNLESIREVRFGPSAASYRTSLNISSAHEPRWITIIYQNVGTYKALHLIALSEASLARWRNSLLHLQSLRRELIGAVGTSSSLEHRRNLWMRHHWKDADQSNDEKLSVDEVMQLCRRLGIESNRAHLRQCFNVADWRNRGYLDFEDFQFFVSLLKRRNDVQEIFTAWADQVLPEVRCQNGFTSMSTEHVPSLGKPDRRALSLHSFQRFIREEQGNASFSDDQIRDLFLRHCNSRLSEALNNTESELMDYEGFLDFLASSDNPPLTDQLPLFSTITSDPADIPVMDPSREDAEEQPYSASTQVSATPSVPTGEKPRVQDAPSRAFAHTPEELIAAGASNSHSTTRKVASHLRKSTVQHDMKRPLSDYYISSSHNTYLVGGQWKGDSTVEGYIRALLQGARSVELDCWDGPNMMPQITHGRTLTSRVSFQDVISAIARYAFVTSPYPLILSLEVHADPQQQEVMARILKDTLGEMLLVQPLKSGKTPERDEELPSPEDLKFKVLVKAKNVYVSEAGLKAAKETPDSDSSPEAEIIPAIVEHSASATETTTTTDSEVDSKRLSAKDLVRRVTRRSQSKERSDASSSVAEGEGRRRQTKKAMSAALASLLIYTVGVKCRGFNKKESYATQHMISLSEKTALKFIRDPTTRESLIKHNRAHLTRVYPSMMSFARLHASRNFLPLDMWAAGCQLVALNWQTTDLGFELNQAMFSRNGRCGYVLKPAGLRVKEQIKIRPGKLLRFSLDVKVISAQQLPKKKKESSKDKEKDNENKEPIDPFVALTLIAPESWGKQPKSLLQKTKVAAGVLPDKGEETQKSTSVEPKHSGLVQYTSDAQTGTNLHAKITSGDSLGESEPEPSVANSSLPREELDRPSGLPKILRTEEEEICCMVPSASLRTPTIKGNGFSPQWDTKMSIRIDVPAGSHPELEALATACARNTSSPKTELDKLSRGLLDLCFVRFEIYDDDLGNGVGSGSEPLLASQASSAASLRPQPSAPTPAKTTTSSEPKSASKDSSSTVSPTVSFSPLLRRDRALSTTSDATASSVTTSSSIDADCIAAYAVPVGALQQGYRHLPLYDSQLSQYLFSTLFVHSKLRFVGMVDSSGKSSH